MTYTFSKVSDITIGSQNYDTAVLLGYYKAGDGGGGQLYWDSSSNESPDGGFIFQVGTSQGRWKRIADGTINVKWYGAVGDNVVDDTAAIQAACNKMKGVYFPPGNYKTSNTINISCNDSVIDGKNAFIQPTSSLTAVNIKGNRISYAGLNVSYINVSASSLNENAVAIYFFKGGSSTMDQVNNAVFSDFHVRYAHTAIKSDNFTGAVWQTEIRNVLIDINAGSSSIKGIGIDLASPVAGADNTTLTIKKVSVQDFSNRGGAGIRGVRVQNYSDVRFEGFSCDGINVTQAGDLMYILANQITIEGSYHEAITNKLDLSISDSAPIQIIGATGNDSVCVENIMFVACKFNCGGANATGAWICFKSNPQVVVGNIVHKAVSTDDGSIIRKVDFSQYRGRFNSNGNLLWSDIAYYQRNANNASLATEISQSNIVSSVPISATAIYSLPIANYGYLIVVKGYYDTDSNISFFDLVSIDSSFNGTKTVQLVSSTKTGYPFINTYSILNGSLVLTRSGGSSMSILTKVMSKLGVYNASL